MRWKMFPPREGTRRRRACSRRVRRRSLVRARRLRRRPPPLLLSVTSGQSLRPGHVEIGTGLAEVVVEHLAEEAEGDDVAHALGELSLELLGVVGLVGEVDDGVRDVAAGGVDLLGDVEALGAEEGGDLAERAGLVLVDDAEASAGGVFLGARMVVGKFTELRMVPVSRNSIMVFAAMDAEFSSASSVDAPR